MYHVTHLTTVHPPFDTRIFFKQARTLVEAGYDVTLIAQHSKSEKVDGIRIVPLPRPRNRLLRMLALAPRALLQALRQEADLYHFHDPELLPAGVLLKLLTRSKVIYDVHEDYPQVFKNKPWLPPLLRPTMAVSFDLFERLAVWFFDGVVAATEEIARRFPERKTTAVKNYPLLASVRPAQPNVRTKGRAGQQTPVLIYVGVLAEIRGIHELVRALELVDGQYDVTLRLLGRFTDRNFAQQLGTLPGFARVDYQGWVSHDHVVEHLERADIGLVLLHPVPNYLKALPVKLFEYLAAGLPVIASDFPLWVDIVGENECGLTADPLDPKEIAKAIEYLLENPELRRKMGENGRQAVLQKYNWQPEAEKLLSLYAELLSR